jgi:hypothetical protein
MNILHLSRIAFVGVGLALAAAVPGHAAVVMAALPAASSADGKSFKDKDCIDCRGQANGGDAARIYFRGERRALVSEAVLAQVSYCSPEIGASYFPEEEEHIAAYLNKQYYRFK